MPDTVVDVVQLASFNLLPRETHGESIVYFFRTKETQIQEEEWLSQVTPQIKAKPEGRAPASGFFLWTESRLALFHPRFYWRRSFNSVSQTYLTEELLLSNPQQHFAAEQIKKEF